MSNTLVILNPAARNERAQRKRAQVESLAQDCVVYATTRTGEAQLMARRGVDEGFERIVAAGGDGTINEVVNGLAGTDTMLGNSCSDGSLKVNTTLFGAGELTSDDGGPAATPPR